MANQSRPIWYAQMIDNSGLKKGGQEADAIWKKIGDSASSEGMRIEHLWKNVGRTVGGALAGISIGGFVKQMVQVRGEFQQLEIAFETMLKSGTKAKALMSGLTQFAAETPFGLQSAASGAKQLIAYGSTAETVIDELRMLGDVAAGTGQSIGDLVYLYGTLRTQGRAYMMDIRQFAGRGIPIYDELAKVLNTTKDQVNEFVSAGKVGFAEIEQAFKNMTSEAGMYGGLMEEQSKSVTGRIEQLRDAIDMMFNEIGQSSEGVVYSAISGATSLVENYEKIGKILISLIATYGAYRTAVLVTNIILKEQAAINSMVAASNGVFNKSLAAQFLWTERLQKAQARLNKTMIANPYVAAVAAITALVVVLWNLSDASNSIAESQKRAAKATIEFEKAAASEQAKIDILFGRLKGLTQGTKEYEQAKKDILSGYGEYLRGLGVEIETLNDVEGAYRAISDAALQSARDRALAAGIQNATDAFGETYSKNISKLREKLIKEFGSLTGEQMLQEIRKSIDSGEVKVGQDVSRLIRQVVIDGGNVTNNTQINDIQRSMGRLVDNVRMGKYALDKEKEELESVLGGIINSNPQNGEGGEVIIENLTQLSHLISEIQSKTNELSSIQSQTTWTDEEKKKITELSSELDGLKKQYQELTGNQWGKSGSGISASDSSDEEWDTYLRSIRSNYQKRGRIIKEELSNQVLDIRKSWEESIEAEDAGMDAYFKEFGTYEQKRLAIISETKRKVKEATTSWGALIAQEEGDKALQELEMSLVKQSDLWIRLFDDASNHTSAFIKRTIEDTQQLLDYMNGVEGAELPLGFTPESIEALKLDAETVKSIMEAFTKQRDQLNSRNPFENLIRGFRDLKAAREKLNTARDAEDQQAENEALEDQHDALGRIIGAAGDAAKVAGQLSDALQGLGGDASEVLGQVADTLNQTASMAVTGMELGGTAGGIIGGVIGLTTGLAKVFGGARELSEETIRSYNSYIEAIDRVVSKQKELLATASGMAAVDIATETQKMLEDQIEATRKIGQDYLNSGASKGFLGVGSSASHGKKLAESLSPYRKELAKIGIDLDALGDRVTGIFDLDGKQLQALADNASLWSKIDEATQNYILNIIDSQDAIGELNKSLAESLTGITFDALKDGLDDLVNQADLAFEDIQESFEDHMSKAILNTVKNQVLNSQLEQWYKQFEDAMRDDDLSSEEANQLREEYERVVREANEEYKKLINAAGLNLEGIAEGSGRESSSKGFASASQDSVSELNGRATAIQSHTYDIRAFNERIAVSNEAILAQTSQIQAQWQGFQTHNAQVLRHLSGIEANTSHLGEMKEGIKSIKGSMDDINTHGITIKR